jgi:hypothetical protein
MSRQDAKDAETRRGERREKREERREAHPQVGAGRWVAPTTIATG